MKKLWICALALLLCAALLTGCGSPPDPRPDWWDEDWTSLGDILAVEPLEPFRLDEINDVLSLSGLYYATWVSGEGREVLNAAGEDATAYDVQIYLLVLECESEADARAAVEDWTDRESSLYETGEPTDQVLSDEHFSQTYQLLPLLQAGAENPYRCGAAAFAVRGNKAVSVELLGNYEQNEHAVAALMQFLACIHYAE